MIASMPLALLFAAAALFSLYELIRMRNRPAVDSYIADREAQATHLIMNGGMAVMVSPIYDGGIDRGIMALYSIAIVILAVRFGRLAFGNPDTRFRAAGSAYHLLGLSAMLYALALMPTAMTSHGHGHAMAMPDPGWTAMLLGTIFLLDGAATLMLAGFLPRTLLRMEQAVTGAPTKMNRSTLGTIRASAFPHVVMDAGMALMLFG